MCSCILGIFKSYRNCHTNTQASTRAQTRTSSRHRTSTDSLCHRFARLSMHVIAIRCAAARWLSWSTYDSLKRRVLERSCVTMHPQCVCMRTHVQKRPLTAPEHRPSTAQATKHVDVMTAQVECEPPASFEANTISTRLLNSGPMPLKAKALLQHTMPESMICLSPSTGQHDLRQKFGISSST